MPERISITAKNVTTTGGGAASVPSILGNNSTAAAAIFPITTTTMANLGIPLTGSTAMGFAIGIMKG